METYSARAELEAAVGKATPSRIAALVKDTANGRKTRLIHDMSRSGVNQKVKIAERVVLPRAVDVFGSCLSLQTRHKDDNELLHFMVLDFADTFKHLKVHPPEKRFLTGWVSTHGWFAYQVLFFGIVSGPLLWARVAALIMRFTAALHPDATDQHT